MAETLSFGQGSFTLTASSDRNDDKLEGFERRGNIRLFNNDGSTIVGLNIQGSPASESLKIRSRQDFATRRLDADLGGGDDRLVIGGSSRRGSVDLGDGNDQFVSQGQFQRSNLSAGAGNDDIRFRAVRRSTINANDGDDRLVFGGDVVGSTINAGSGADRIRFRGDVRNTRLNLGGKDGDRDVVRIEADANVKGLRIRGADDNDVLFIGSSRYDYDGGRNWVNVDDADDIVKF